MIIQQVKVDSFLLSLQDSATGDNWGKDPVLQKYLRAALKGFEDFLFHEDELSLKSKNVEEIELSLTFCDSQKIQSLNRDYRDKDKPTDVLSFPVHENLRDSLDELIWPILELGDVFICKEIAIKQAEEFKISKVDEAVHLLVHGFLHLLGYDHEISDEEEELMLSLEKKLLDNISKRVKDSTIT